MELGSQLHLTAWTGSQKEVIQLIQQNGADVNWRNEFQQTPLHSAALRQDKDVGWEIIKYLLEHGADPHAKDGNGDIFLHLFVVVEDDETLVSNFHSMVEYLVGRGLQSLLNSSGGGEAEATPLQLAVGYFEPEERTLTLLQANGIDVNFPDKVGDPLLAYAVYGKRRTEFLSYLINQLGADPRKLNDKGGSVLHIAASSGTAEALKYFIDLGVFDCETSSYWDGLLHSVVKPGGDHIDVIPKCRLLIANGAYLNSRTNGGDDELKQTPLHFAAHNSDLEVIRWMIDNGGEPQTKDGRGYGVLHLYLWESTPPSPSEFHDLVEVLIQKAHFSLFNTRVGEEGTTLLQLAVYKLELEERTLNLLGSHKVNFRALDNHGDSLLAYAIVGGRSLRLISILMDEFRIKWRGLNKKKNNLLHIAAEQGNSETLKYFLELGGGLNRNQVDKDGDVPLHCVFYQEEKSCILEKSKLLIENGADINSGNGKKETPLHLASLEGNLEVIQWLLENGADPYAKDKRGLTFLHNYLSQWKEEVTPSQFHLLTEYLIGKGLADLFNIRCGSSWMECTPLQAAFMKLELQETSIHLLRSNDADFQVLNNVGDSVLVYAVMGKRSFRLLSILMEEFKLEWDGLNQHGNSFLHHAAQTGNLETLKYFLAKGVLDVNGKDGDGDTPLHCAVQQEEKEELLGKCRLLIENGAEINILNNELETAFSIMSKSYHGEDKEELTRLLTD